MQETNQNDTDKHTLTTTVTDMLDPDINQNYWQIMSSSDEDKQQTKPYNANKWFQNKCVNSDANTL